VRDNLLFAFSSHEDRRAMADATLIAERRPAAGKGPAGRIRREGLVPAVVYGLGDDNVSVSVSSRELIHILSGGSGMNTLITLKIDGADELAIARQIQRHPVKGTVMHVDFVRVRADQTIQAEIPVHLTGEAEGAVRGGILEQLVHTLTVEAKPSRAWLPKRAPRRPRRRPRNSEFSCPSTCWWSGSAIPATSSRVRVTTSAPRSSSCSRAGTVGSCAGRRDARAATRCESATSASRSRSRSRT